MGMSEREIIDWIAGSPETNTKELKWHLMDMGIYLDDRAVLAFQLRALSEGCNCSELNSGGDCDACIEYYSLLNETKGA